MLDYARAPRSAPGFSGAGRSLLQLYTLTNDNGLKLTATDYGATITALLVPDRDGKLEDIVLGYESPERYLEPTPYFGATVGRIANRIADARFDLEGKHYALNANNGPHCLHGGARGWDKVLWETKLAASAAGPELHFSYTSPAGEEGFPGTVRAGVVYTLTHRNELVVTMTASTDETTIVNMAHHTYWNLGGEGSGSILDHELTLYAERFTPSAAVASGDPVPDGREQSVRGTPFDFTTAKPIGRDLQAVGGQPIGFDHNWIVDGEPNELRRVARARDPRSGRVLSLEANQPGVQFYSGKFLDGSLRGKSRTYQQYDGFCLETQKFPNAINVPAWRDQVLLRPGQAYEHVMVHRFSVE